MIRVELAQGEGAVSAYVLDDGGCRVSDLLSRAGVDLDGRKIRVNGDSEDTEYRLHDGDLVMLQQKIPGDCEESSEEIPQHEGIFMTKCKVTINIL